MFKNMYILDLNLIYLSNMILLNSFGVNMLTVLVSLTAIVLNCIKIKEIIKRNKDKKNNKDV